MKLQQVGLHLVDDGPDVVYPCIDEQGGERHERRYAFTQFARLLDGQRPLAARIKDKTDGIRACLDGSADIFMALQAADLDPCTCLH